jgi:spore germination protein GerM
VTRRRVLIIGAAAVVLGMLAWGVTAWLERLVDPGSEAAASAPAETAPGATGHITATVYYGSEDGQALVPVRREVPLAEGIVAQGRQILIAQLREAPEAPLVSVIPPGTTLRSFYVSERGDAFVDLSREVSSAHPGGSMTELLTVYAVVAAVTSNLPAIERVQILVDGKEVDTIAGHVDVRRPLPPDKALIREAPAP